MDIVQTQPTIAAIDNLFDNTQLIDMTPDVKTTTTLVEPTGLAKTVQPSGLSSLNRSETTAKSVDSVLESLDFAAVRLEGAMYRIGYLESQVDSLQEQLKVLPEFRARAARAILTERENVMLIETLSEYESELEETHALLEKLNKSKTWQFCRWAFGLTF